jgi:hypothetical protein
VYLPAVHQKEPAGGARLLRRLKSPGSHIQKEQSPG